MKLFVKYNLDLVCKTLLKEKLETFGISYTLGSVGEIHLDKTISLEKLDVLSNALEK